MPLYSYRCECGHEFEEVLKISDRNIPKDSPCISCGESGKIDIIVSAPLIVSGVGDFRKKVPDAFKDRLREIKKNSGKGNTIDV